MGGGKGICKKFLAEEMRQWYAYQKCILVIEAVSGTLNNLTPEQMEMFDAAVERT